MGGEHPPMTLICFSENLIFTFLSNGWHFPAVYQSTLVTMPNPHIEITILRLLVKLSRRPGYTEDMPLV